MLSCHSEKNEYNGQNLHPVLILQHDAVPGILDGIQNYPLLNSSFLEAKEIADKAIEDGIVVPFPKDPGGG